MTVTTLEPLQALDFPIPCAAVAKEDGGCGGDNPAVYVMYDSCGCGHDLSCQPCLDLLLVQDAIQCTGCHRIFLPPSQAWNLIEPLNRKKD